MQGIAGKVHVITGGYGGIARATAEYLGRLGAHVVLTGRDERAGDEAARVLSAAAGIRVRFYRMDVADPVAVDDAVSRIETEVGPIYGAVINAAIAKFASSFDMSDSDWRAVLATNLDGAYYCARSVGRRIRGRGGSIVLISSIASRISGYPAAFSAYGASKAGLSHLAEMLGVEWAPDLIRVNAVEPGYTETQAIEHLKHDAPKAAEMLLDSIPLRRFIKPMEIAHVIAFLLSDLSSAMTGSVVVADGGASAR